MKTHGAHAGKMEAQFKRWGAKLDELKAVVTDKWDTFRSGVESAWGELEATFRKLKSP